MTRYWSWEWRLLLALVGAGCITIFTAREDIPRNLQVAWAKYHWVQEHGAIAVQDPVERPKAISPVHYVTEIYAFDQSYRIAKMDPVNFYAASTGVRNTTAEDQELLRVVVAQVAVQVNGTPAGDRQTVGEMLVSAYRATTSFLGYTETIESNGDPFAANPVSSARGPYQFLTRDGPRGSIPTAVNRFERHLKRHGYALPDWADDLRDHPTTIMEVSKTRQAVLAFINIAARPSSHQHWRALFRCQFDAVKPLYAQYHHTRPDRATRVRMDAVFAQFDWQCE